MKTALSLILLTMIAVPALEADWLDDWNRMQPIKPKSYICYRVTDSIKIDGIFSEDSWDNAPWTDDFADIQGDIKPLPRFRTRAKMLWDDEYFYVGAELEEPHAWATLTQHDSVIFHDNDFEIFIDPNSDNHEYYEIEFNALGTEWDLLLIRPYKDGGPAVNSWEIPGLKVAVYVDGTLNDPADTDKNWTVEVAIPWKVLAECAHRTVPPSDSDGDQWRINFSRVEWEVEVVDGKYQKIAGKPEDNWVWSPQGIIDMHRPEKWGYVQFSSAEKADFRPDPSAPARHLLHQIYYAQRDHKQKHGRWASDLKELGIKNTESEGVEMQVTQSGFEVVVQVKGAEGEFQRWHIRQDSRLWAD